MQLLSMPGGLTKDLLLCLRVTERQGPTPERSVQCSRILDSPVDRDPRGSHDSSLRVVDPIGDRGQEVFDSRGSSSRSSRGAPTDVLFAAGLMHPRSVSSGRAGVSVVASRDISRRLVREQVR